MISQAIYFDSIFQKVLGYRNTNNYDHNELPLCFNKVPCKLWCNLTIKMHAHFNALMEVI